jgi:hypothetical protein
LKPPIKNLIPIKFDDVAVSSKVFMEKRYYLVEKWQYLHFIGLGKSIDYKSLKRYSQDSGKEKETLPNVCLQNSLMSKLSRHFWITAGNMCSLAILKRRAPVLMLILN